MTSEQSQIESVLNSNGGYDTELFSDQSSIKNFQCPICMAVWRNPIDVECAQHHILCQYCFTKHIETYEEKQNASDDDTTTDNDGIRCVMCRDPMSADKNKLPHPHLARMVGNLQLNCPNLDKNCDWKGLLSDLDTHLTANCMFEHLKCKFCNTEIVRRELQSHLEHCEFAEMPCVLGCGQMVARSSLHDHQRKKCPNFLMKCRHSTIGCDYMGKRKTMSVHLRNCLYRLVFCNFKKYGCNMRVRFSNLESHLATHKTEHLEFKCNFLEKQNDELKDKIDCVEIRVDDLETESTDYADRLDELEAENEKLSTHVTDLLVAVSRMINDGEDSC